MTDTRQDWPPSSAPIESIDDCDLVYGDPVDDETIFTDLDLNNDCIDAGGHLWLQQEADVHCVHCGVVGMPVKASREAEGGVPR